ncbi:beta-ketoacyl synthase N-terminal-like domain-containing protein [Streptomyces sp. TS71-3]|uniref:beta-ketoacyl synthase N-terminal-like domain-containing protein n=1 Tax=Streptomyces sp. TS71-3 TaxID=2733862 RepID=UPI001B016476|nr:beta-ketoacyl synthase N-terminal-like domain-containing protein [Streptomyces sp. TS71-3]GHJ36861.1 hypothetical protein Sm713_24700 [Streptomyces sp. TS71-3]
MTATRILVTGVGTALPGVSEPRDLLRTRSVAGEASVDPAALIGKRGLRYKDRATQLALCAAQDALADAGLLTPDLAVPGGSVAVVASSNLGNLDTVCEVADGIKEYGVEGISPMGLPNASSNVVASTVAIRHGLRGPNLMVCNGAASGLDAVYWGASLIAARRVERALVIGVESRNAYVDGLLGRAPGDLLDGAVALVLERSPAATARGARGTAVLGTYTRRDGVEACLGRLLETIPGAEPGVWFVPERHPGSAAVPAGVPRNDLSTVFGRASGAYGVLQCAAAVGWFGSRDPGAGAPALVTAGTDEDDGVAGLVLTAGAS